MLLNETVAVLKSMDQKQNNNHSPYYEEQDQETKPDHYRTWVRGSWLPPPYKKYEPYYGQYSTNIFQ
ncbi:hypothetical protein G6F38_005881 [Rhizopus arrhizus]|nr:hypothetical protein G6F38_005881 [Rhizopus arrhizus]